MSKTSPYWIAFGDIHSDTGNIAKIPGLAEANGVIVTGDLTVRGGVAEASRVVEAIRRVNPALYAQIGNMDHAVVQTWLDDKGLGLHARVVELAPGLGLMGVGWSTPTPFGTPSEVSEDQVASWLCDLEDKAKGFDALILASHTPPHGTVTDRTGSGMHVGSTSVREFIARVRPALCLTGHIHESRGVQTLCDTLVVNPGDLASGGYVRVDWDGKTPRAELLTV